MGKQFITEAKRLQKLAGIITESQLLNEEISGLIVVDNDGSSSVDPEVYETILRQAAKRRGIELDQDKVEELIDELINGGYGADEYANATPEDILDDYIQWTTD
jgi:hypothetical protein